MDQYAGSPDHTTYCYQELAAYKIQKKHQKYQLSLPTAYWLPGLLIFPSLLGK